MVLDPAALPSVFGGLPAPGFRSTSSSVEGRRFQKKPLGPLDLGSIMVND
jgi:hypothetical protein